MPIPRFFIQGYQDLTHSVAYLRGGGMGSSGYTPPAGSGYGDAEVPSGTIDGANDTFTLLSSPSPADSCRVFVNGMLMQPGGEDYTLTGDTIVFEAASIPDTGDSLICFYRY